MGYMRHHAIVVTGPANRLQPNIVTMASVQSTCAEIAIANGGVCDVTAVTKETINGYASFMVAPDGSKDGWDASDQGDKTRDEIIEYLESLRYEDRSTAFHFVEVQFADDYGKTKVLRDE